MSTVDDAKKYLSLRPPMENKTIFALHPDVLVEGLLNEIERLRKNGEQDAKYMLAIWRMRQNRGNEFMEAFDQTVKLYEDEQPAKATGGE